MGEKERAPYGLLHDKDAERYQKELDEISKKGFYTDKNG